MISPLPLINRDEIVAKFASTLRDEEKLDVFLISGEQKSGKSRLVQEFQEITKEFDDFTCVFVDFFSEVSSEEEVLHQIAVVLGIENFQNFEEARKQVMLVEREKFSNIRMIGSSVTYNKDGANKRMQVRETHQLTEAFIKDIKGFGENRLVLIFDAFEKTQESMQSWVYSNLISGLLNNADVKFIISGIKLPSPKTSWQLVSIEYELLPISFEEYEDYCTNILELKNLNRNSLNFLIDYSDGKPGLFVDAIRLLEKPYD